MMVSATTSSRSVLGKLGWGAVYRHLPSVLLVPAGKKPPEHVNLGRSERGWWPQNKDQRWKN